MCNGSRFSGTPGKFYVQVAAELRTARFAMHQFIFLKRLKIFYGLDSFDSLIELN